MTFVCDRCGHCCRKHRVPLTIADLRSLSQSLGESRTREAVEWLPDEALHMEGEPESFFSVREGRRVLVLRHVPSDESGHASSSACVFLSSTGCSIHDARPAACRTYPFDRPSPVPKGRRLGLVPHMMCPEETGVFELVSENASPSVLETFADAVAKRDGELSDHALMVERHNRRMKLRLQLGRLPQTCEETLEELLLNQES